MKTVTKAIVLVALVPVLAACTGEVSAAKVAAPAQGGVEVALEPTPQQERVARGKYLVTIAGCNDCHTPLKFGPNGPEPDMERALSGHPAEMVMPEAPKADGPWLWTGAATNTAFAGPWGISYARNLTPDQVSGLGIWTEDMFIKTLRTGKHMGVSRPILPPMPWQNFAHMTDEDLKSVFAYLRSVKPIRNEVPDAVLAPPPAGTPAS